MVIFPGCLAVMAMFIKISICDLNWNNGTGGGYKWAKNCDFVGSDITTVSSKKLECGGMCYDNPKCTHFSWNAGNCYLKHFDDQPTAIDLNSIFCGWMSGGRFQPQITGNLIHSDFKWQDGIGGIKWAQACKFHGPDDSNLKTIPASLPMMCIDKCVTLKECTHFNWDSGNCYIKHLDYAVPAYNFDGSPCGWVNRSEPRQKKPDDIFYFDKPFNWLDGYNGQLKWSMDCDFDGSIIAQVREDNCGIQCVNNRNCTHFSMFSGTCYLKHFESHQLPMATRKVDHVCGWVTSRSPSQPNVTTNNNKGVEKSPNSFVTTLNWLNGSEGGFKWAEKCDFFGSDILKVPSKKEDCGGICYDNPECTHFTWNENNCIQKHFKIQPTAFDFSSLACGWISGRGYHPQIAGNNSEKSHFKWQEDIGGIKWAKACQFYGPDGTSLKTINSTTIDVCGSNCVKRTVCTNFNWKSGTCYLKHFDSTADFPAYSYTDSICGWVDQ